MTWHTFCSKKLKEQNEHLLYYVTVKMHTGMTNFNIIIDASCHLFHLSDNLKLWRRFKDETFSSEQALQVACHISTSHVSAHDRMREREPLIDGHCVSYTIPTVKNNASSPSSCISTLKSKKVMWIQWFVPWLWEIFCIFSGICWGDLSFFWDKNHHNYKLKQSTNVQTENSLHWNVQCWNIERLKKDLQHQDIII